MTISQVSQVKTIICGKQPLCFDYIILSVQELSGLEKAFADNKVAPRPHKRSGLAEKYKNLVILEIKFTVFTCLLRNAGCDSFSNA